MLRIRRFEERAGQLYGMGLIGGFCHLYIGEEAVAVGVAAARRPGDQIITSYRDHGYLLACGADRRAVMAELTGRAEAISEGKGGSMHMFAPEHGFFGGHGIVGAPASLGTGLAFANRYRDDGKVAFVVFGEWAANQGQASYGRALEAARGLHHREQPLRHGNGARTLGRRAAPVPARAVVRHSRPAGGRDGRAQRAEGCRSRRGWGADRGGGRSSWRCRRTAIAVTP